MRVAGTGMEKDAREAVEAGVWLLRGREGKSARKEKLKYKVKNEKKERKKKRNGWLCWEMHG
jgi:hypothetical protein